MMVQYIAHHRGVDEAVAVVGEQEDGFQIGLEKFVGKPYDALELEVGSRSQPAQQEADMVLPAIVHGEAGEAVRFHLGFVLEEFPDKGEPGLEGEHAAFVGIDPDGHDDFVKEGQGSAYHAFMSQSDGVERAGEDGNPEVFHFSCGSAKASRKQILSFRIAIGRVSK